MPMGICFKPLSPHVVIVVLYEPRVYRCKQGGTSPYGNLRLKPGSNTNQSLVSFEPVRPNLWRHALNVHEDPPAFQRFNETEMSTELACPP